jgi:hypothetical protein
MFLKKQTLLFFALNLLCLKSIGQSNSSSWAPVRTPNAASLGSYGEIPVNYFNGLTQIDIPLYKTTWAGLEIPVSINYHGGGIKVDEHPSVVGLGWALMAGGVITRKVNCGPDDYLYAEAVPVGDPPSQYKGYYLCGSRLNVSNWSSSAFLINSKDAWNTVIASNPNYIDDGEPDEFYFNFLGHSGKFLLNEQGQWKVVCSDNTIFNVSVTVADDYILDDYANSLYSVKLKKIFKAFTITASDGYKYYFGGTNSNIEFSRGLMQNASITSNGYAIYVTPMSWYLNKVEAPDGQNITFAYERGAPLFSKQRVGTASSISTTGGGFSSTTTGYVVTTGAALSPVYIKTITTPIAEISFEYSTSIEKKYKNFDNSTESTLITGSINKSLLSWGDFHTTLANTDPHDELLPHTYKQLDNIKIKDKINNVLIRKIDFDYQNTDPNSTTLGRRLTLYNVKTSDGSLVPDKFEKYSFAYNNVSGLPDYGERVMDHWGYFNDVNYMYSSPYMFQFDNWRQPDAVKMAYGVLTGITYPTGGTTTFVYEPHSYSKTFAVHHTTGIFLFSAALDDEGSNKTGGGLRIKEIHSNPGFGSPEVVKQYQYLGTNNLSSGTLGGKPFYSMELVTNSTDCYPTVCGLTPSYGGTWTFIQQSDNSSFNPLAITKGVPITYSKVKELLADGSYTTFDYTNFDSNPYCMDEVAGAVYDPEITNTTMYRLSSRDIERGLLTSKKMYSSSNQLVYKEDYEYTNLGSQSNDYSKAISAIVATADNLHPCVNTDGCRIQDAVRYAFEYYYYNKRLSKITKTEQY